MQHKQVEEQVAQKSALIYRPISAGLALFLLLVTTPTGGYPLVARLSSLASKNSAKESPSNQQSIVTLLNSSLAT